MPFRSDLRKNPFAKLLFFYLSGIIGGSLFTFHSIYITLLLAFVLILFTFLLIYFSIQPDFHTDRNSGITSAFIFIVAGILSFNLFSLQCQKINQTKGFRGIAYMQISEPVTATRKSVKCFADIEHTNSNLTPQKILVYFQKDSASLQLTPGDRIEAQIRLTEIPGPKNPEEFDYQKYLAFRRIFNQTYIQCGKWKMVDHASFSFKALSFRLRNLLLEKYSSIHLSPTLYGLLSAVTLGYKNELDVHTRQVFSKAGVMHVMALSGFNVAVIAFALNYLLFFTNRFKFGKYVRLTTIILFIWFFAFITGFSSSVTRASLMISLALAGKEFYRHTNVHNILYASAFILLALQPALIYDISFQLSFAAVFGIIVFYPRIDKIFHFRNRPIRLIWRLFAVSLSAQLATMPITIASFHQFPVYFWITNLYVVPLVSVIICVSMIFLMISFIKPLMFITGKLLGILLVSLYESVSAVEFLPFAVINNIRLPASQLLLLICILMVLSFYLFYRKYYLIIAGAILIIALQITGFLNRNRIDHQQILLVGNLKNNTFINIIEGRHSLVITDARPESDPVTYSFENFWVNHGIRSVNNSFILPGNEHTCFVLDNQRFQISNSSELVAKPAQTCVLIVTGKALPDSFYIRNMAPAQVILDSSVPVSKGLKWMRICQALHIPCHNVNIDGAWIFESRRSVRDRQDQYLAGQ